MLGGMGPEATVLLQQRVINAVAASDDIDHVPLLVHMNSQVPSRLDWLLQHKGDDPGIVLAEMARTLELAGAEALAMPCNTAHHFAEQIVNAVDIPLLHMVEAAAARASARVGSGGKVGILASPATQDIRLFHEYFEKLSLTLVFPKHQELLLQAIQNIKAHGISASARKALNDGAIECANLGAGCLLVGCSEFSIIADAVVVDLPVIDTIDVLVADMVDFSGASIKGA